MNMSKEDLQMMLDNANDIIDARDERIIELHEQIEALEAENARLKSSLENSMSTITQMFDMLGEYTTLENIVEQLITPQDEPDITEHLILETMGNYSVCKLPEQEGFSGNYYGVWDCMKADYVYKSNQLVKATDKARILWTQDGLNAQS